MSTALASLLRTRLTELERTIAILDTRLSQLQRTLAVAPQGRRPWKKAGRAWLGSLVGLRRGGSNGRKNIRENRRVGREADGIAGHAHTRV